MIQPEQIETIVIWFGQNRVRVDTGEEVVEGAEKAAPSGAWDIPKGYKKCSGF